MLAALQLQCSRAATDVTARARALHRRGLGTVSLPIVAWTFFVAFVTFGLTMAWSDAIQSTFKLALDSRSPVDESPLGNWGSQWAHSLKNVSVFVDTQDGVLIVGRGFEGSTLVRGVELSAGLQLYCGLRSEYTTQTEFYDSPTVRHYSFLIFTKFFDYHLSIVKARRVADFVLYDTVDNFDNLPAGVDALLVNTRAQKAFYEYMNLTMPIFVLPHHVGNHNGFFNRGPRPSRAHVLLDPRVPRGAVDDLSHRVAERGGLVEYERDGYAVNLPRAPNSTYPRSMHFALQAAASDVIFRWVGYKHVNFCFKPGHRLANSLSVGVPTITDASEGFLEVLDDADLLESYPFLVHSREEGVELADKLLTSNSTWTEIGRVADAINAHYSLRAISWRLFDIFFALREGCGQELAAKLSKPPILATCGPERMRQHYKDARTELVTYEEFGNKTKRWTHLFTGVSVDHTSRDP